MYVALSTPSGGKVVFQIGVARKIRLRPERRTAQIGMQHDACGIEDSAQRWTHQRTQRPLHACFDGKPIAGAGPDLAARVVERPPDLSDHEMPRNSGRVHPLRHLVNGWNLAQLWALAHALMVQRGRAT